MLHNRHSRGWEKKSLVRTSSSQKCIKVLTVPPFLVIISDFELPLQPNTSDTSFFIFPNSYYTINIMLFNLKTLFLGTLASR